MEIHAFAIAFIILLAPYYIFVAISNGLLLFAKKKLPPGPTGLPIIGSLLTLRGRTHESLVKLAQTYGPLMSLKLGFVNVVVASSAEMAMEILQKHDLEFTPRSIPDAATAAQGYDLDLSWLPVGSQWKKLRKIYNTHFLTPHKLDLKRESRHKVMTSMIQRVKGGEAVQIRELVLGTVVKLLANSMFSADMELEVEELELAQVLTRGIIPLLMKPNVADYFPFLRPFDLQGIRREIGPSYNRMHAVIDAIIDMRRKKRNSSGSDSRIGDFLDVLIDYTEDQGPEGLTCMDVKHLIMDSFAGGTDTTTTIVEWAMAELLRNPTILSKLKQQLSDKIAPGKTVQEQDIPGLPYLTAVIKETMRLHPPTALLMPRRVEQDVEIHGFNIPRNSRVWVNVVSNTRDASYWDRPACFVPERFLDSDMDFRGRNFSFTPFSTGRRICPGLNLGVRMVSLVLATLVHEFDWKLPEGVGPGDMDMTDKFSLTLKKAEPLVAIPVRTTCTAG